MRGKFSALAGVTAILAGLAVPAAFATSELPVTEVAGNASALLPGNGSDGEGRGEGNVIGNAVAAAKQLVDKATGPRPGAGPGAGDPRVANESRGTPAPVAARAQAAASRGVEIRDFAYQPKTISISVGDTVTWTNSDDAPHDADAFEGSFNTPILGQGESASVTFDQPGSFKYFCSVHPPEDFPEFTGTVEVAASNDGNGSGSGGGGGDTPVSSDPGTSSGDGGATADATDAPDPAADTGSELASGSSQDGQLASTGQELLPLALLGGGLFLLGLLLRRPSKVA